MDSFINTFCLATGILIIACLALILSAAAIFYMREVWRVFAPKEADYEKIFTEQETFEAELLAKFSAGALGKRRTLNLAAIPEHGEERKFELPPEFFRQAMEHGLDRFFGLKIIEAT